ncbi:MAG: hypothetical protein R3F39_04880 [Myxococcota bacterium]
MPDVPAKGGDRWVLEPGADRTAARLGAAAARSLGRSAPTVDLSPSALTLRFVDDPPGSLVFTHSAGEDAAPSAHGGVRLPEGLADEDRADLLAALDAVTPPLAWRRVSAPPVVQAYPVERALAQRSLAARKAAAAARDASRPERFEFAPVGARLAAEAAAIEAMGLADPESSASIGTIEARLRDVRGAPKLWAAAAYEALRNGHPTQALAYADVATRMDHLDADALHAWHAAHGRPHGALPDDAVASALPQPPTEALPPLALWLAAAAAFWFAAAYRPSHQHPGGPARLLVVVSLALGAGAYLASDSRTAAGVAPPPLPDPWLAPLAGGPCDADPALWTESGWLIFAECDGAPTRFYLAPGPTPGAPAEVGTTSARPGPTVDAATRRLRDLSLSAPLPRATRPADAAVASVVDPPADRAERRLAAVLAAASLPALLFTIFLALASLFRAGRADRGLGLALALALALTLATRTLTPARLVMEYTGYDLTARLASLAPLPRYGAGSVWLYGPVLDLLGVDHRHLQWTNRLLGALTLLPLSHLTYRLSDRSRLATAVAALLFASLPVFWRDHSAEGIQTGTTFLLITALAALAAEPRPRLPPGPVLAVPLLAWAAVCRPEVLPALPFAAAAVLLMPGRTPGPRRAALLLAACALVTALLPHAAWLAGSTARQLAETGIATPEATLQRVPGVLLTRNIFVDGPWLPAACLVWLLAAFWTSRRGLLATALMALSALAWLAMTAVDLPRISIPRVHLPALCLLLPLIGVGAARLHRWPVATWLLSAAVLASTLVRAPAILATGNADAEEALIRAAAAAAQQYPQSCVATLSSGDPPPPAKTPRHFPRYLFGGHPVTGLDELQSVRARCPGPAIAILGTRCYMAERPPGLPAPPAPGLLDVCQRFAASHRLTPLSRAEIPNRAAGTFAMYPDAPTLDVGVYLVESSDSDPRSTP